MNDLKDKIKKCSKSIQEHISTLEYHNRTLKKENEELRGKMPESNTYKSDFGNKFYFENYSRITFVNKNVKVEVMVSLDNHIRVDIGDGYIIPQARNVIHIVGEK